MLDTFSILLRSQVAEGGVESLLGVVATVLFEHDLGFEDRAEDLAVEKLVSKSRVEGLGVTVLPGCTGRDEQRGYVEFLEEVSELSDPLILAA